jgi:Ankyrin repeats (3 copies)
VRLVEPLLLDQEGIEIGRQGWTALSQAAHYSNLHRSLEIAKLLLEREDIDVNLRENSGRTALYWACARYISHLLTEVLIFFTGIIGDTFQGSFSENNPVEKYT